MGLNLLSLSVEIIIKVLLQLDLYDLIACKFTCCHIKSIIDGSAAILYQIELPINGLTARSLSNHNQLPVSKRRQLLKHHHDAWNTLEWTTFQVSLEKSYTASQYLSGRTYAQEDMDGRNIHFVEIPSTTDPTAQGFKQWGHADIDLDVLECFMDSNLDLLIIFESPHDDPFEDYQSYVHIRSRSDLRPYPNAAHATLDIPVGVEYGMPHHVYVRYGLLGAIFGVDDDSHSDYEDRHVGTLVIWDYVKGILLGTFTETPDVSIRAFAILDPHLFLLTRTDTPPDEVMSTSIEVHHIDAFANPGQRFIHTATYKLPPLTPCVTESNLSIISDPPSHQTDAESDSLFCVAEDQNIIVFHWVLTPKRARFQRFFMFVHESTFSELLPSHDPTPKIMEWEAWGPKNTRIFINKTTTQHPFDQEIRVVFAVQTYGGRFVGFPTASKSIQLLDFTKHASAAWKTTIEACNPSEIDKHCPTAFSKTTSSYVVPRSLPTIVPCKCFVGGSVSTSLPYCVASRPFEPEDPGRIVHMCLGEGGIVFRLDGEGLPPELIVLSLD